MKETGFIKQNKDKWQEFESVLNQSKKDPDKLSHLFIQLTDDLSYSRTFYPNRSVRVYLNNLASRVFQSIYKNQRFSFKRIYFFFTEELPYIFWQERKMFYIALLLFCIGMLVGVFSSLYNPAFPSAILGDSYVEMTENYIADGDPMAVYKRDGEMPTFLYILFNNIFVSLLYFSTGLLAGLGTLFSIFRHGVMVGVFQWFFIERGVWRESFFSIWVHGTLEISALILESAAGLILGKSLLFPGTYTRLQSFLIHGRRAAKILIATIPLTVVAAVLEGFATRHTEWPYVLRGIIIFGSLFFLVYYFFWLPWRKSKSGFLYQPTAVKFQALKQPPIQYLKIKNNADVFSDSVYFIRKNAIPFFSAIAIMSAVYTVVFGIFFLPLQIFDFNSYLFFGNIYVYFQWHNNLYSAIPIAVCITALFVCVHTLIMREFLLKSELAKLNVAYFFKTIPVLLALGFAMQLPNLWHSDWNYVLFMFILPFIVMLGIHVQFVFSAPAKLTFGLKNVLKRSMIHWMVMYLIVYVVANVIFLFNASALTLFYFQVLNEVLGFSAETNELIYKLLFTFLSMFTVLFMLAFLMINTSISYFSMIEKNTAISLRKKLEQLGVKIKVQGLEKETPLHRKNAVAEII